MVDKKISMDIDDVLELDYLVEEITNSSSVSVSSGNSADVSYMSRNTGVLNPSRTGTYELEINGQIIEVNVADIPDSGVYLDDYAAISWRAGMDTRQQTLSLIWGQMYRVRFLIHHVPSGLSNRDHRSPRTSDLNCLDQKTIN